MSESNTFSCHGQNTSANPGFSHKMGTLEKIPNLSMMMTHTVTMITSLNFS